MLLIALLPFLGIALAQGYVYNITTPNSASLPFGSISPSTNTSDPLPLPGAALFANASATGCGEDSAGNMIDIAGEIQRAEAAGLPMMGQNGSVQVEWRELGEWGVGNVTAEYDPTGTGDNFAPIVLLYPRDSPAGSDQPLTLQLPQGVNCTSGPGGDACLLRVLSTGGNGTYGSCFAVAGYSAATLPSSGGESFAATGGLSSDDTGDAGADSTDDADSDDTGAASPTTPNVRPSPSKVTTGRGSLPSSLKRRSHGELRHATVKKGRKNKHAVKGARMESKGGSAWSRAKRWRLKDEH